MMYDLDLFFQLSLDMFCIAGVDGYFKKVNPAFEKTLGWTVEQLTKHPFWDLIHPEDIDATRKEVASLSEGVPTISFENRFRCSDGTYRYLTWNSYPDPKTGLLYAVARDNTERRKTEQIFRLAIESSPSGVILVDEGGKITLINAQIEKYFGYSREELIGQSIDCLVPKASQQKHVHYRASFFKSALARPMGEGRDLFGLRKNGEQFPVEIGLNPIQTPSGMFVLAVIVDITQRKKFEISLQLAKKEAERTSKLKSEFLNLMSHELRTPLTVILGNLPLLTKADRVPSPQEVAEIATDIEGSGKHLLTLINDLLDISKVEAGQLQLERRPILISELISSVVNSARTLAADKGLEITTAVEDTEIVVDLVRMKQVLLNLLSNAIKFTDHGKIVLKAVVRESDVIFEVQDFGCGIREEDLPRLFNLFTQVDESSTRKASGSGLGLLITKRLVELHGGRIHAASKYREGSTFTIILPRT